MKLILIPCFKLFPGDNKLKSLFKFRVQGTTNNLQANSELHYFTFLLLKLTLQVKYFVYQRLCYIFLLWVLELHDLAGLESTEVLKESHKTGFIRVSFFSCIPCAYLYTVMYTTTSKGMIKCCWRVSSFRPINITPEVYEALLFFFPFFELFFFYLWL